jgi:outer membrane protein
MISKTKHILLIAFTILTHLGLNAQVKVGYINTNELLLLLPEVKVANDSLKNAKERQDAKIQNMVSDLTKKAISLEQRKNEIAPVQYQKEVELLKAEEQKIYELESLGKQELTLMSENLLNPIQTKVNEVIKEVATENGYSYVFDAAQGMVLYTDPSVNLLDKVKAKLTK